jgi:hypothetical protein
MKNEENNAAGVISTFSFFHSSFQVSLAPQPGLR